MSERHFLPADIERTSMAIIRRELAERGFSPSGQNEAVVCRVIHTTADFDYARNLRFSPDAVAKGVAALRQGADIVTDTVKFVCEATVGGQTVRGIFNGQ